MFFVYVRQKTKDSPMPKLYAAGMPKVPNVYSDPKAYCQQSYDWLLRNWHSNPILIPMFVELVADHKKKGQLHVPVNSMADMARGQALIKVLNDDYEKIEQLSVMYKDFLGNKPPPVSKMFDKMTYAERQEILRKSNMRLEEIPKEAPQPSFKRKNPYSLDQ